MSTTCVGGLTSPRKRCTAAAVPLKPAPTIAMVLVCTVGALKRDRSLYISRCVVKRRLLSPSSNVLRARTPPVCDAHHKTSDESRDYEGRGLSRSTRSSDVLFALWLVSMRPLYNVPLRGTTEPGPRCNSELNSPPIRKTSIERYIHVSSTITPPTAPYVLL